MEADRLHTAAIGTLRLWLRRGRDWTRVYAGAVSDPFPVRVVQPAEGAGGGEGFRTTPDA